MKVEKMSILISGSFHCTLCVCVLLHSCLTGCKLKRYTLQGRPLLSVTRRQICGEMFFQRSQAHRCVSRPNLSILLSALSYFLPISCHSLSPLPPPQYDCLPASVHLVFWKLEIIFLFHLQPIGKDMLRFCVPFRIRCSPSAIDDDLDQL